MFDTARLLNERLQDSDIWAHLAVTLEDTINRLIGDGLQEVAHASNSQRYLRGDVVDPRRYPLLQPVDSSSPSLQAIIAGRIKEATVKVCYPRLDSEVLSDDPSHNAILYLEIAGLLYWTPVNRLVDRALLIPEAKYLGFDYFSDTLTNADYGRMVDHIGQYWAMSGAYRAFGHYIGFIKDIRILVAQLWTPEDDNEFYTELKTKSQLTTPIYEPGGTWYPTSHTEMFFDVLTTAQNTDELRSLFFLLAPIHLVLHRVTPTIFADVTLAMNAVSMLTAFERGDIDVDSVLI